MAKITKLVINGVKGITATQELTGKDIIVGPNGSGKTSRLKGLVVGIQGFDPEKGKRPMDTMRLAGSNEMAISVYADTGFSLNRQFRLKANDKIDHYIQVDPNTGQKGINQCEARIKEELGDFPVMWDLNEFFNLSSDKKRDFIFNLSDAELAGWNKDKVTEIILKKVTEADLSGEARETFDTWLNKSLGLWKEDMPAQIAFNNMIAYLKDQLSHWNKKEKENQDAQKRVTELKAEYEDITAEPIADTKKAIEDIQEELTQIREQIAKDEERAKQANNRAEKINQLKEKIKSIQDVTPEPVIDIAIESMKKNLLEMQTEYKTKEKAIAKSKEELLVWETSLKEKRNLAVRLVNHSINKICPVSPNRIKCDQDFDAILTETNSEIDSLEDCILATETGLIEQQEKLSVLEKKGKDCANNIEIRKGINLNKEKISGYEKQLQELQKEDISTEGMADPETLKLRQQGLTDRLNQKKGELESKEKTKNALATANELAREKIIAQENMEAIKSLIKLIGPKGIQGDMVRDITKPLKDIMLDLVKTINPNYDFMFDLGSEEKPVFDLCCKTKEDWVLFDSLSAGESVVFSAALATALIIQRNPACKILGIEAGECDRSTIKGLLIGLNKLSIHLDNVVICTHDIWTLDANTPSNDFIEGWTTCLL